MKVGQAQSRSNSTTWTATVKARSPLCHLLGFELLPRLKPIHSQRLYLPSPEHTKRSLGLQPMLTRTIRWELIAQQYNKLVKYAVAIRDGTADAEAILARFTRNAGHPAYQVLAELGQVIKTTFLCRYLHEESLRREIHEGLNVVESWNSQQLHPLGAGG